MISRFTKTTRVTFTPCALGIKARTKKLARNYKLTQAERIQECCMQEIATGEARKSGHHGGFDQRDRFPFQPYGEAFLS